ncbi:hypothetical protein C8R47DRAFT_1088388, partial [Mycena vitilis]
MGVGQHPMRMPFAGMGAAGLAGGGGGGGGAMGGATEGGVGSGENTEREREVGVQTAPSSPSSPDGDESVAHEAAPSYEESGAGDGERQGERARRRRSWWRPSASGVSGAGRRLSALLGSGSSSNSNFNGNSSTSFTSGAPRAEGAEGEDVGLGAEPEPDVIIDEPDPDPALEHQQAPPTIGVVPPPVGPGPGPGAALGGDASRTFLIYVIGGYYPPEHGILNGASGAESLEALLELPELLGYARPPTASKAEIARAGLTVLRRDALPDAEKEGRVTASCVERCLICLDDYAETEDIRVLGCRHAFHQTCVDRWLETGRNNCPACRTKGVPTEGMTSSPAAHTQA